MPAEVTMSSRRVDRGRLKGWHALLWFVAFFGFMFFVNGIFLWTAITTFPGEDVEKSYLTGIDYNQEIGRRAHQAEAGWSVEVGVSGTLPRREVQVRFLQQDGTVLSVSEAALLLRHPADRRLDRPLALTPNSAGVYVASLDGTAPGHWIVQVSADVDPDADGFELKAAREIMLP